jgi:hypothetical protein
MYAEEIKIVGTKHHAIPSQQRTKKEKGKRKKEKRKKEKGEGFHSPHRRE